MPTLSSTIPAATTTPSVAPKQYSLSLLSEYAHTLDALPLDLSRIFADLRELDAVLTSTVSSITVKIHRLIETIENKGSATNEQRLWLLGEIAEDAGKVRPGAEDKIRIATQAADVLQTQASHLTMVLRHVPEYDTAVLMRRTVYPHVSSKPFAVPPFESGRRRRVAAGGGLLLGSGDASPNKRRRIVQEEDMEYGTGKTPRKDKPVDGLVSGAARGPRGGGRAKKVERAPSPSESLLSIASPLPGPSSTAGGGHLRSIATNGHRHNGINNNTTSINAGSSSKRRGVANNSQAPHPENSSLLDTVLSRKEHQHFPPSSSTTHPSLMDPERSGAGQDAADRKGSQSHNHASGKGAASASAAERQDWSGSNGQHQADAGHGAAAPSTSAARASTQSSLTTNLAATIMGSPAPGLAAASPMTAADDVGDGEGDAEDGQTYCICNNISYGEMIACDDGTCVREWFHLACMGLTTPPEGSWFCDECTTKRANRRPSRGGKKKGSGGGGRVSGRSGANGS